MQFDSHGNGNGYNDLYVLPDNTEERDKIISFLKEKKVFYQFSHSDVEGQEWYGKTFIEIPFGEYLKEQIKEDTHA